MPPFLLPRDFNPRLEGNHLIGINYDWLAVVSAVSPTIEASASRCMRDWYARENKLNVTHGVQGVAERGWQALEVSGALFPSLRGLARSLVFQRAEIYSQVKISGTAMGLPTTSFPPFTAKLFTLILSPRAYAVKKKRRSASSVYSPANQFKLMRFQTRQARVTRS